MSKIQNGVISTLSALAVPDPHQQALGNYDYVYYGATNNYPQNLADMFTISPTHEAVLESKRNFLNGDLKIDAPKNSYLDLEDIDGEGASIEELADNINGDIAMFESFYLEVLYNKAKTRIVAINHIPYEDVRVGKKNERGIVENVYISPDWSRKYLKKNQPITIPTYTPNVKSKTDSQIIISRVKRPNQPYYTIPSYASAIQYILLEDDIAELNRNDVTNGFFPSMVMHFFNGEPTEADKSQLEQYVNGKFKGKSGSKVMMFFGNDPTKKVQLDTHTSPDLGDYSSKMIPLIENKILTGHRAPASLIGVATAGGFSSKSEETQAAFELYTKNVIVPLQKLFINALRKVYKFNGADVDIVIKNEMITLEDTAGDAEINTEDNVNVDNIDDVDDVDDANANEDNINVNTPKDEK